MEGATLGTTDDPTVAVGITEGPLGPLGFKVVITEGTKVGWVEGGTDGAMVGTVVVGTTVG